MQCQKLKTYMETGRVVFLPARSIRPNPSQPRKVFRPEALEELQPILYPDSEEDLQKAQKNSEHAAEAAEESSASERYEEVQKGE